MDSQKPPRDENGRLRPGAVLNPHGQNGNTGWQPYGKRSVFLLEKYTPAQIKEIIADEKKQESISTYDLMILTHIAATLAGEDKRLEREQLVDRIEGKASQPLKFSGDKDNPLLTTFTLKLDGISEAPPIPETE